MTAERKRLWFAVTLPPLVWMAQGAFGWFVASHACPGTSRPWSLSTARWLIAAFTAIALLVSLFALRAGTRRYEEETKHTLSMMALVVGGALTLGLIFGLLPEILIGACGEMR